MKSTNRFTFDPTATYLFIAGIERIGVGLNLDDKIKAVQTWLSANNISLDEYIDYNSLEYDKYVNLF